jgi:two-component system response regulator DesR
MHDAAGTLGCHGLSGGNRWGLDLIKTLIAEQISLIRAGLVALVSGTNDIEVVAEVQSGTQALCASEALCPDVAVLSAELPDSDGYEAARTLHDKLPECRTLIMGDQRDPVSLLRAVESHAVGFLARDAAPDEIIAAIRGAATGRKVVDPDLAFAALSAVRNPLTSRELDALRLAAAGATTAEIAGDLFLAVGTVRNYLSRVITKTGARNRVDAIRIAADAGWLDRG